MCTLTSRAIARVYITVLAFVPILAGPARAETPGSYSCPVLGARIGKVAKDTLHTDFRAVRYYFCCASCKPQFEKNPDKFLKDEKNKDRVIGASLFDPITTKRLDPEKAAAHSDYNGIRYFFARAADKKAFDKEPKKHTVVSDKEVLFCPVSNEVVASHEKASDYSDLKDTRYYFCCAGCKPLFDKNPEKYLNGLEERMNAKSPKKDST